MSQTPASERRQDGAPVDGSGRERTLLVIAYFFPPLGGGGVQRTVKFLKYLRPLGWRAEVVTVRSRDYWVIDRSLAADVPSDTVVHRTHALTGLGLLALAGRRRPGASEESGVPESGAPDAASPESGAPDAASPESGAPDAASPESAAPESASPDATAPPPARSSSAFRWLRRLSSFFLVPDAYVGWFPFALAAARARLNQGQIDVLLTTSSPDTAHLVGLVLRERLPVPWVADFRDPWVRRLTFEAPTRLHHRLHLWLERRVLERADLVLVTNQATRDDFLARHRGIPEERFAVIANGYDPEDLAAMRDISLRRGQTRRESAAGDRRFVLAHTGLLSGKRTLAPLIDGIERLLAEHPELRRRFLLRQVGPRESVNDQLVNAAGVEDCVTFLPPTGHRQILAEMAAADALLLIESAEPAGRLITPGKIFEYLASGRPILALVPEGPAADLVRSAAAGEVVAPGDAARIAAVLARWLGEGPPASPIQDEVLAPYARPALAARLAALLEKLAGASAGSFRPW